VLLGCAESTSSGLDSISGHYALGLFGDAIDFFFDCEGVEARERQTQEQIDPATKGHKRFAKCQFNLFGRSRNCDWVRDAPMGGDGLAGPDGADFFCGVVADGEDEIHFWRVGLGEFEPMFAAEACGGNLRRFELLERFGADLAGGITSGAEGGEMGLAVTVQNRFGHDGAGGIAGAQE
jgi:hypothetical protein